MISRLHPNCGYDILMPAKITSAYVGGTPMVSLTHSPWGLQLSTNYMSRPRTFRRAASATNISAELSATFPFGVVEAELLDTGIDGSKAGKKMVAVPSTALLVRNLRVVVCI
jgi:hypothetical protein